MPKWHDSSDLYLPKWHHKLANPLPKSPEILCGGPCFGPCKRICKKRGAWQAPVLKEGAPPRLKARRRSRFFLPNRFFFCQTGFFSAKQAFFCQTGFMPFLPVLFFPADKFFCLLLDPSVRFRSAGQGFSLCQTGLAPFLPPFFFTGKVSLRSSPFLRMLLCRTVVFCPSFFR